MVFSSLVFVFPFLPAALFGFFICGRADRRLAIGSLVAYFTTQTHGGLTGWLRDLVYLVHFPSIYFNSLTNGASFSASRPTRRDLLRP